MKTKKQNTKGFILALICSLICSIGIAMFMKWKQTGKALVPETLLVTLILFALSIALMFLAKAFFRYFDKLTHQQIKVKILPAIILFYISSLLLAYVSITTGDLIWYIIKGHDLSQFLHNLFEYELKGVHSGMFKWLIIATIAMFYLMWQKAVKKQQKLEEEKLKYQYKTLKSQVSPHFLFNSLNTLSSLITSNSRAAENFVDKLSDTYRYIVDNEDISLIPLHEEIKFVKDYFELQSIRDEGKITLDIFQDEKNHYKILPVSLQSLIENALKHNMATGKSPLQIKIYLENDMVVVENNLQEKNTLNENSGTGLQNLKTRVKLETGKDIIVDKNKNSFKVSIPLIAN